jgi:hypothetical protein
MAPQAPRNVRAGTPGNDSVSLSWDSAGSGISYKVYYNNQDDPSGAKPLDNLAATPSMNVNGMASDMNHYFWVSSVKDGQESGKSPVVTVRTAAVPVNPAPAPPSGTFRIGGRGPGGGIVFFAQGGKYMEVSEKLGGNHNWAQATTVARNYQGGGYSDWRLPTKDELNLVYQNLRKNNLGNMGDSRYWSSTEHLGYHAWYQLFGDGRQASYSKNSTGSVRAVRDF